MQKIQKFVSKVKFRPVEFVIRQDLNPTRKLQTLETSPTVIDSYYNLVNFRASRFKWQHQDYKCDVRHSCRTRGGLLPDHDAMFYYWCHNDTAMGI